MISTSDSATTNKVIHRTAREEINYGFTKVRSDNDTADHLISENEMGEVKEDPMESPSDVESIEQGECFSGFELVDRLSKLYSKRAGTIQVVNYQQHRLFLIS